MRSLVDHACRLSAFVLLLGGAVSLIVSAQTTQLALVSTAWPPFTNVPGQPRFALDLVDAALGRISLTARTTIVSAGQFTPALLSGQYDGSAAAWKDPERERLLIFSQPYLENRIGLDQAYAKGVKPLRDFMIRQTRESDLALMVEISHDQAPKTVDDVKLVQLIPAFMLNELRTAFQIGFVIFLPFLLIDLVVSSVLMALGMMMVPPAMIALPLKVLMFVLIDGWNLVVRSLVTSFH